MKKNSLLHIEYRNIHYALDHEIESVMYSDFPEQSNLKEVRKIKYQLERVIGLESELTKSWSKLQKAHFTRGAFNDKYNEITAKRIDRKLLKEYDFDSTYTQIRAFEKTYKKEILELFNLVQNSFQYQWDETQQNQINSGFRYFEEVYFIDPDLDQESWLMRYIENQSVENIRLYLGNILTKYYHTKIKMLKILESTINMKKYFVENFVKDEIRATIHTYKNKQDSLITISLGLYRRLKSPKNAFIIIDRDTVFVNNEGLFALERMKRKNRYQKIKGKYLSEFYGWQHLRDGLYD